MDLREAEEYIAGYIYPDKSWDDAIKIAQAIIERFSLSHYLSLLKLTEDEQGVPHPEWIVALDENQEPDIVSLSNGDTLLWAQAQADKMLKANFKRIKKESE